MARLGYASRGAIYLMVGISAALTTFDPNHKPGGILESLKLFQQHWTGAIVLVILALGMACLAGWLTAKALYRRDRPGHAHMVLVAGMLGDAMVYVAFMGGVLGLVFGMRSDGDEQLQSWIGWLAGSGAGAFAVGAVGAIVCVCGAGLIGWGAVGDIEGPLELPLIDKKLMLPVARYGTGGRGVAILLVGGFLVASAIHGDAHEAHGLGGALKEMRALPGGAAITGAFALAFVSSALFDFVVASFRRFNPRRP